MSSSWFIFALLSGAEQYGGGVTGVIKNAPNALPWLLLFVFVYIVWKYEQIGGGLLIIAGIFSVYFFNALESVVVLFAVSLPLIILGSIFLAHWYREGKRNHNPTEKIV